MSSNNHGGSRKGAGRPTKVKMEQLQINLTNAISDEEVLNKLAELIRGGNMNAITKYLEYRHGKAVDNVKMNLEHREMPNFPVIQFLSTEQIAARALKKNNK